MARKGKKAGKGKDGGGGFSVILGTTTSEKYDSDREEEQAERTERKESVPEKPAPKPVKPASPGELRKKSREIKKMMASLEEARSTSNMPTYSYNRQKKMYEAELAKIGGLLEGKGGPTPSEENGPPPGATAKAGKRRAKAIAEGAATESPDSGRISELAQRVSRMESFHGMMPGFKSQLDSLKGKMDEYQQVVDRLKSDEQALALELPRVKRSLSALKGRARRERGIKKAATREPPAPDASGLESISRKVDTLAGKLTETLGALKSRIDQVSVIDEAETRGYVKALKADIRMVRSELAHFLKKDDLKKLVLQPVAEGAKGPVPAPKAAKPRAKKRDIVAIDDLGGHLGKDVTIECSLSLLKGVTQSGMRMYWYRIEDGTGESILISSSELKEKHAVLKGHVKKTKTGSVYLFLKKIS